MFVFFSPFFFNAFIFPKKKLWELLPLQRHAVPAVAEAAGLFSGEMERPLFVLSQTSGLSCRDVVDKLRRKKSKTVPLEHRAKRALLPHDMLQLYFAHDV